MLLKEREITQAEAALTKKAAGNALCWRESVSAAKKEGEWERGFWGEGDRGRGLEKEETVGLTVEKWKKDTSLEVKRGRKVSTFVEKCPLLLTRTFVGADNKGDVR